jgi:hypothetical protein
MDLFKTIQKYLRTYQIVFYLRFVNVHVDFWYLNLKLQKSVIVWIEFVSFEQILFETTEYCILIAAKRHIKDEPLLKNEYTIPIQNHLQ